MTSNQILVIALIASLIALALSIINLVWDLLERRP